MTDEVTEVLVDQNSATNRALSVFSNAKSGLDILAETIAPPQPGQSEEAKRIAEAYLDIGKRGGHLRILTRIDEKNLAYCKELTKSVEIRHLDDVRGNFATTESEYMSSPTTAAFQLGATVTVIYSNAKSLVDQNRSVFETSWSKAQPAAERIMELEEGHPHRETRVIRGEEQVVKFIGTFLSRAAAAKTEPYAYGASDLDSTKRASEWPYYETSRELLNQSPGFKIRHITDVQRENLEGVKLLLQIGYDVRHLNGNRIRFSVSRDEYIETTHTKTPGGTPDEVVWSNDPQLVGQATRIFDALWNTALPADTRIREIEEGVAAPAITIIRDPSPIRTLYLELIRQAKENILLILPTANTFERGVRIGVIEALRTAASERRVSVRMISPISSKEDALKATSGDVEEKVGRGTVEHRRILEAKTPDTVTVLVVDRSSSLVIEQKDDSKLEFDKVVGVATYSTRNPTVLANASFFERMWEEVELREKEEVLLEKETRARRTAELLQDILSHDMKNYNQVSRTSAEIAKDDLEGSAKVLSEATALVDAIIKDRVPSGELGEMAQSLRVDLSANLKVLNGTNAILDGIIRATEGTSDLIDKANKLGRVISQDQIQLRPVDLESSIRKSMALVVTVHPDRRIIPSFSVKPGAQVLADDMLEEVFTNILSNSVEYTERDEVPVAIEAEEATLEGKPGTQWKITFTDQGKGIPDEMKDEIFARYLKTASGTGLGLSIVYALVVEKYSGKVRVTNRVEGDHTKGTRVELWLRKAA